MEAYLDRLRAMIQRDKNHPCIVLWSLGNEAFYGRNHRAMYKLAKQLDPTRPVHYEQDHNVSKILSHLFRSSRTSRTFLCQTLMDPKAASRGSYTGLAVHLLPKNC